MKLPILTMILMCLLHSSISFSNGTTDPKNKKIDSKKIHNEVTAKQLQDDFMQAYLAYANSDFIESKKAFRTFFTKKETDQFQNLSLALFYYSKACLNTEDLVKAVEVYQKLLSRSDFKKENLYEQTYFEMALCQMKLNEKEAIPYFEKIALEFSGQLKTAAKHYLSFCNSIE